MGFAVIRPLARHRMPHIRFLFIGPRVCSTLLSALGSRRCRCASLSLHLHQVVKRTFTSKLSNMLGTREYSPAEPGALSIDPLKAAGGATAAPQNHCGAIVPHVVALITAASDPYPCCRIQKLRRTLLRRSRRVYRTIAFGVLNHGEVKSQVLRELSNFCCLPGKDGGSPNGLGDDFASRLRHNPPMSLSGKCVIRSHYKPPSRGESADFGARMRKYYGRFCLKIASQSADVFIGEVCDTVSLQAPPHGGNRQILARE